MGAGALLIALLPILVTAAVAVFVEDGRPVLFRQQRSGRGGGTFQVGKFRTMRRHDATPEELGQVFNDHALVTRNGRILRRLKIDELPQLLNVLRGDMSLVGPRPTLPSQVREYSEFQRRRLDVRPGMTGWAQVNGNAALSWTERIALDVWYVDHWTLELDLRIIVMTLGVVVRGERPAPVALKEAREYEDGAHWRGAEHSGRP